MTTAIHPEFDELVDSWELSMRADGFAENSVRTYRRSVAALAEWVAEHHPGVGPAELQREHVRGWLAHMRENASRSTARIYFTGARQFGRWLLDEGELDTDPFAGLSTPRPGEPETPVVTMDELVRLLDTCSGQGFVDRRDNAMIRLFVDSGPRLAEMCGLNVDDVAAKDRAALVSGKGYRRAGPRPRVLAYGYKTAQAIDAYLRARRKHPWATDRALWLGSTQGARRITPAGVKMMIARRGEAVGLPWLHPHALRHAWAHYFRANGGNEGDLMRLGGWRSRQQLDRYGGSAADSRAREAYLDGLSLGDKL